MMHLAKHRNKIILLVIENAALLTIGAILVVGFWYHSNFYSIGLPLLVAIGAVIIVLMIITITLIRKGKDLLDGSKGFILLDPGDKEKVLDGLKTQAMFRGHTENYKKGQTYHAKVNITSKKHFAKLYVKAVKSAKLGELKEPAALKMGYCDLKELKADWKKRFGRFEKDTDVTIVDFELLGE